MGIERVDSGQVEIILVDDSETDLEILRRSLARAGPDGFPEAGIHSFTDAAEALAHLPPEGMAVVVCDYSMPGSTGLDWLPDFVRANVGPIIILTGQGDEQVATEAFRKGAADYLVKSTVLESPELLSRTVREAMRRYRLEQHNADLARRLKIANTELHRKNVRLTELTETAHRFVDNVAHEFRTPLTVIREFASIITDGIGGPVTDKQQAYLRFITDAARDLGQLVDDFLDSSKLKARALRVNRRAHSVAAILDQVRPLLATRAASKDIRIVEEVAADLPEIFADVEKVGRVVVNLAVNAIKFSPEGSTVRIRVRRATPDEIEMSVVDAGPGMSEDDVAGIFDRFSQASGPRHAEAKGFGLGLSIAQELVWLNLGTLTVASRPGAGSTFAFTLPVFRLESIVPRFLQWVGDRFPEGTIAMIRAAPLRAASDLEPLRAFLVSVCYPMDLVFESPEGGSILLIGVTGEPDRWAAKLLTARTRCPDVAAFDIEPIGTWPSRHAVRLVPAQIPWMSGELPLCA